MRYFATVCGAEAETQVEKRVLASNPVMEVTNHNRVDIIVLSLMFVTGLCSGTLRTLLNRL